MDSTPWTSRQILLFPALPKCPVLSPSEWWWSCLNRTGQFRWMSLLTLVYTTQQSTLQHIPYPGTTKLWEWYIWHSRKLFRESMGIYNYYTIKQVSTRIADFCPMCPWQWCQMQLRLPHGNWIHSFLSTCEWPQSTSSLSSESPYYLPHHTLASDTTLTVCASAFSSQGCDEPKTWNSSLSLVNLSTMWTSTKANRNQMCKPLQFWWGSSIPVSMFSGRGWFMAGAAGLSPQWQKAAAS